jgi:hypothetical protein
VSGGSFWSRTCGNWQWNLLMAIVGSSLKDNQTCLQSLVEWPDSDRHFLNSLIASIPTSLSYVQFIPCSFVVFPFVNTQCCLVLHLVQGMSPVIASALCPGVSTMHSAHCTCSLSYPVYTELCSGENILGTVGNKVTRWDYPQFKLNTSTLVFVLTSMSNEFLSKWKIGRSNYSV